MFCRSVQLIICLCVCLYKILALLTTMEQYKDQKASLSLQCKCFVGFT